MNGLDLTDEEWELVNRLFPELKSKTRLTLEEVKILLQILRLNLAGHEIRDIVKEPAGGYIVDDVNKILGIARLKAKERNETQEKNLKTLENLEMIQGSLQSKHSYSIEEEKGFTNWLNKNLGKDKDCLEAGDIPMKFENNDLFTKLGDGVVLCKVINLAVENTIDERTINKAKSLNHIIKKHENLTLAINSAAAIGCCVTNIGASEIMEGKQHIILGLIWQLIRKGIVDTVTLSKHAELAALLRPGETLDDLNKLKPEELLLRWVNHQLEKAGCERRMRNFGEDIHDSEIYGHLLQQIAPENIKSQMTPATTIMSKNSMEDRAKDICDNATKMDAGSFLQPENIFNAKAHPKKYEKLHLGFVATLFNLYPNMDPPKEVDLDVYKETLEEKTYRNWMNSLGVTPYVNHIYDNTNDGLIFLQLIDNIKDGTVDQSKIIKKYDARKEIFQKQANCAKVVEYGRSIGLKMVNISGEDIRNSEKKLILGTCFQMMQAYLMKLFNIAVRSDLTTIKGDEEVLNFANEKLKAAGCPTLSSFRDKSLLTSKPILDVVEKIKEGSVDKQYIGSDNFSNAVYALSVARKCGAKVYALPEHIVQLDGKMIMTIFLCLMILYHEEK